MPKVKVRGLIWFAVNVTWEGGGGRQFEQTLFEQCYLQLLSPTRNLEGPPDFLTDGTETKIELKCLHVVCRLVIRSQDPVVAPIYSDLSLARSQCKANRGTHFG